MNDSGVRGTENDWYDRWALSSAPAAFEEQIEAHPDEAKLQQHGMDADVTTVSSQARSHFFFFHTK